MLLDWPPTQCFLEKKTIEAAPRSPWRFITTSFDASTLSPCRVCHFENSLLDGLVHFFSDESFCSWSPWFVSKYFQDIFSKRYVNARWINWKGEKKEALTTFRQVPWENPTLLILRKQKRNAKSTNEPRNFQIKIEMIQFNKVGMAFADSKAWLLAGSCKSEKKFSSAFGAGCFTNVQLHVRNPAGVQVAGGFSFLFCFFFVCGPES